MEPKLSSPPRVVFLSNGGLLGDLVLRRLQRSSRFDIVGVIRSRRVMIRGAGFLRGAVAYFRRCGVIYTVYLWTITTFAEFLGLFTGRGSITARAKHLGLPLLHSRDVNDTEGRRFIQQLRPDLLIAAHFDQRLYPPLCDGPEQAAVNVHPSPLPRYRGLEPVLHASRNRDDCFGVTVHRLTEDIDGGPIIAAETVSPDSKHSVLRTSFELFSRGAELLSDRAEQVVVSAAGEPQKGPSSYYSWPQSRDVWEVFRAGQYLARWSDVKLFFRDD